MDPKFVDKKSHKVIDRLIGLEIFAEEYIEALLDLGYDKGFVLLAGKDRTEKYLNKLDFDRSVRRELSHYYGKMDIYGKSNAVVSEEIQNLIFLYIMDLLFAYDFYSSVSEKLEKCQLKSYSVFKTVYNVSESKAVIARKKHAVMYAAMENQPYIYKGTVYTQGAEWQQHVNQVEKYFSNKYYPALYYTFLYCLKSQNIIKDTISEELTSYLSSNVISGFMSADDIRAEIEREKERRKKRTSSSRITKKELEYQMITIWYKKRISQYLNYDNKNENDCLFALREIEE